MCSSGRCRHRRPGRSSTAVPIAALAASVLLAACGSSRPGPSGVTLVPTHGGSSQAWRWNANCTLRPTGKTGCWNAGPILGFGQLNGDAWNLGGSAKTGSIGMSTESSGAVRVDGHFNRTPPCTDADCLAPSAFTWVRGYPNVLYGIDQCLAGNSPRPSPQLPLPLRLDSIPPHLTGVTAYAAETSRVTYDITYDLWLNPTATGRPCRSKGTLEILVWTDYDAQALLPASMQLGTADIPAAFGRHHGLNRAPWTIYATNIGRNGDTAPWGGTLWFVPSRAEVIHHGHVSVDLSAVLSEAGRLLHDDFDWLDPAQHYWLDTVSFGVEFGPANGKPLDSGPSQFSFRISSYCLNVKSGLANATCG